MLELISLARHNHTHAAQAQNGHKEENAKKSAYHRVIKSSIRGLGNLKAVIGAFQTRAYGHPINELTANFGDGELGGVSWM